MSDVFRQSADDLYRRGKHVFDLRSLSPLNVLRGSTPAPTEFTNVEQLLTSCPDVARSIPVESSDAWPSLDLHYVGDDDAYRRAFPARDCAPTSILELRNGRVFGRHCFPIAANGKTLIEFGFHLNADAIAKSTRFGKLNPRFHRRRRVGDMTARRRLPAGQRFAGSVAALNLYASHNFYHWMIDILPRLEALHRAGIRPDKYMLDCYQPFQLETLRALGIDASQIIQPHNGLLLEAENVYTVTRDNPDGRRRVGAWLANAFTNDARNNANVDVVENMPSPERIYIRRGRRTSRRIHNQAAFETSLRARGFECHELETLSMAAQARLFQRARIIVGLHGAGLSNAIYAPSGATIVELMPRGRVNFSYPLLSQSLRQQHWIVSIDRVGWRQGVVAPIDLVANVLNQIERQPETSAKPAA